MPENTNPDESAFPFTLSEGDQLSRGLTKREHFAAMAMQGLIERNDDSVSRDLTDEAVWLADALIHSLNNVK